MNITPFVVISWKTQNPKKKKIIVPLHVFGVGKHQFVSVRTHASLFVLHHYLMRCYSNWVPKTIWHTHIRNNVYWRATFDFAFKSVLVKCVVIMAIGVEVMYRKVKALSIKLTLNFAWLVFDEKSKTKNISLGETEFLQHS